eukprot:g10594.t1
MNLVPLTALGERQATRLGQVLGRRLLQKGSAVADATGGDSESNGTRPATHHKPAANNGQRLLHLVFSSPAVRCVRTAELCLAAMGQDNTPVQQHEQLQEIGRGAWTGLRARDMLTATMLKHYYQVRDMLTATMLKHYYKDPSSFRTPQGESEREVEFRMTSFLHEHLLPACRAALTTTQVSTLNVCVFSHGIALKTLMRFFSSAQPRAWFLNLGNTSCCCSRQQHCGSSVVAFAHSHVGGAGSAASSIVSKDPRPPFECIRLV